MPFEPTAGQPLPLFFLRPLTFLILLAGVSWLVFRSKLETVFKTTFSVLPVSTIQAGVGIGFYRWSVLVYLLGTVFALGLMIYIYRTNKAWLYYFSVLFASVSILIVEIFKMKA